MSVLTLLVFSRTCIVVIFSECASQNWRLCFVVGMVALFVQTRNFPASSATCRLFPVAHNVISIRIIGKSARHNPDESITQGRKRTVVVMKALGKLHETFQTFIWSIWGSLLLTNICNGTQYLGATKIFQPNRSCSGANAVDQLTHPIGRAQKLSYPTRTTFATWVE